jgi:hypothetical protein
VTNADAGWWWRGRSEVRSGAAWILPAFKAMADPVVRKKFEDLGLEMPAQDQLTPEALGIRQKTEVAKWWPMIKAANVKVE